MQCGGGAVDVMAELVAARLYYPADAPLMAYGWRDGRCLVWNKYEVVLLQVVAVAGLRLEEYALQSSRIGGASHLSAAGVPAEVLQNKGRWRSDANK